MSNQKMNTIPTQRNSLDRNWSSAYSGELGAKNIKIELSIRKNARKDRNSNLPKLKVDAKKPNGKAPMPNDIWNPPSAKPNPWNGY